VKPLLWAMILLFIVIYVFAAGVMQVVAYS